MAEVSNQFAGAEKALESDPLSEAEKALEERVSNFILKPTYTPGVSAPVDTAYELMQEDLKFQSMLGKSLEQQQSLLFNHAAKKDLVRNQARNDKEALEAQKAIERLTFLVSDEGGAKDWNEALNMYGEENPGIWLNKTFNTALPNFRSSFEDDQDRTERIAKDKLSIFTLNNNVFDAQETATKNQLRQKDMSEYVEHLKNTVDIERWGVEKNHMQLNMEKTQSQLAMNAYMSDGGLASFLRKSRGSGIGGGKRQAEAGQVSVDGFVPDEAISPEDAQRMSNELFEDQGVIVGSLSDLASNLTNDHEVGFLMDMGLQKEMEQSLANSNFAIDGESIKPGDIKEFIGLLGNSDFNRKANNDPDGPEANKRNQIKQIFAFGAAKFQQKHKVALDAFAKSEADAAAMAKIKENMKGAGEGMYDKMAAVYSELHPEDSVYDADWESANGKEDEPKAIRSRLDSAWNTGADVLLDIYNAAMQGPNKPRYSFNHLKNVYHMRIKTTGDYVKGDTDHRGNEKGDDGIWPDGHSPETTHGLSPTQYVDDIRSFITEVYNELQLPTDQQADLVDVWTAKNQGIQYLPNKTVWKKQNDAKAGGAAAQAKYDKMPSWDKYYIFQKSSRQVQSLKNLPSNAPTTGVTLDAAAEAARQQKEKQSQEAIGQALTQEQQDRAGQVNTPQ